MRSVSLFLLLASCAAPAMAQTSNWTPTDNTTNRTEGPQRVQGTGDPNRGDPVNVRMVTCSGGTCTPATASSGGGTPTGTAGSPNAAVVSVQGVSGGTPQPVVNATQLPASLGQKTMANSLAVTLASDGLYATSANQTNGTQRTGINDGADVTQGAVADTAYAGTGSTTVIGGLKGLYAAASGPTPTGNNLIGNVIPYGVNGTSAATLANPVPTQIAGSGTNVIAGMADFSDAIAQTANSVRLGTVSRGTVFNGSTWDRARGDTTGAWVGGHASIATAQVSVGTTATQVIAARTGRQKVIFAVGAANTCAFGASGVTSTTGFPLQPVAGAAITLDTAAVIFAVCSATTTISVLEQY